MRRKPLVQRMLLVTAVLIAATGLTASGASAGTTGTIAGTLTNSDGAGVANAGVYLDGPSVGKSTTTAEDGSYTIAGLVPGGYRVRFQPPGRPAQYAYGKTNYSEAAVIAVSADATATVNDTLIPVGYLSGRLVDRDGSGVAGAQVDGYPTHGGPFGFATTTADGSFTMAVVPGSYRVRFYMIGIGNQYAYGTLDWGAAAIFTVAADQTVAVNDTLMARGSLAGRVVTSTGAPVTDAEVQVEAPGAYRTSPTDASGNYRFNNLVVGAYRVSVRLRSGAIMYAPQTREWRHAEQYAIVEDQQRTLDITLLPTGTITGRFTQGLAGVENVAVSASDGLGSVYGLTDRNGVYRFDQVFGGSYKVHFTRTDGNIDQWAYGKVSEESAHVFTLVPGTTLTVDDTRLATGTLHITARNAFTGAQLQTFSMNLGFKFWGWTDSGVVTMADVPSGTYTLYVSENGYGEVARSVTIDAGRQTDVAVSLTPWGKVPVTVVDAATGNPVQGVCVWLTDPKHATVPDGCGGTDEQGREDLFAPTGRYNLLAMPNLSGGLGMQWVGPAGGTGDQREASVLSLTNGQSAPALTIRLDRAGSITGRVTSETGQPVTFGEVGLLTQSAAVGGGATPSAVIEPDGTYRLDGLGPYQWPLILHATGHAYQWSGVKPSRYEAQKIQVTAGGTATYNHVMKVGTTISGTVTGRDGARIDGWLRAFNAETGDHADQTWMLEDEPFTLRVLAPQQVRLATELYWLDGTSFETAERLPVGASTITLNLCVTGKNTMRECADIRPLPSQGTSPERRPPGAPIPTPTPLPSGDIPPTRR